MYRMLFGDSYYVLIKRDVVSVQMFVNGGEACGMLLCKRDARSVLF